VKFADLAGLEIVHCLMKHTYFSKAFFILKITCCFHSTSVCVTSFMTARKVRPFLCWLSCNTHA
jgi:hypothetical protein